MNKTTLMEVGYSRSKALVKATQWLHCYWPTPWLRWLATVLLAS